MGRPTAQGFPPGALHHHSPLIPRGGWLLETTTVPPEATGAPWSSRAWLGLPAPALRLYGHLRASERSRRVAWSFRP